VPPTVVLDGKFSRSNMAATASPGWNHDLNNAPFAVNSPTLFLCTTQRVSEQVCREHILHTDGASQRHSTYGIERVYDRVGTPAKFSTEIGSQLPSTRTSRVAVTSSPLSVFNEATTNTTNKQVPCNVCQYTVATSTCIKYRISATFANVLNAANVRMIRCV
jgi:hypothetical protein